MEEAAENGKESSHSAHANEWSYSKPHKPRFFINVKL